MSQTALNHRLNDIDSAGVPLHAELSPAQFTEALGELGADAERCSATLNAHLSKQKETVLCAGQLRGTLVMPCQRCLEPARVAVDVPLHTVFTEAPADVEMLSLISVPPKSLQPAERRYCENPVPSFTHDVCTLRNVAPR